MMNDDPMTIQHGGTHYKGMAIEPFEMSLANRYDGAIHSVVKYVSRHAAKNGAEDLWKAHHIIDIRRVQMVRWGTIPSALQISMTDYIRRNKIDGPEAAVLLLTDDWSSCKSHMTDADTATAIRQQLERLIKLRYPT